MSNLENHTALTIKQLRFKTSMLRSGICNYSDTHIVVKEILLSKQKTVKPLMDLIEV